MTYRLGGLPYNIEISSYTGMYLNVESVGGNAIPTGFDFTSDKSKMFLAGSGSIYQFSVPANGHINNATYDSKMLDVSAQVSSVSDIKVSSSDNKMYILDGTYSEIHQYSINSIGDISISSYDSVSFSVYSQEVEMFSMFFGYDGGALYTAGRTLIADSSTITPSSYAGVNHYVGSDAILPTGIRIKQDDGLKTYISDRYTQSILQYANLSPWDVDSMSLESTLFVGSDVGLYLEDLYFKPDGSKLYTASNNSTVHKDVGCATYDGVSFVASYEMAGIFIKPDGTKMYGLRAAGIAGAYIDQFSISSPGILSSASYEASYYVGSYISTFTASMVMTNSGDAVYVSDLSLASTLLKFSITSPWNIDTSTNLGGGVSAYPVVIPYGLSFKNDGSKMYMGYNGDVYQFNVDPPWTGAFSNDNITLSTSPNPADYQDMSVSSDGLAIYFANDTDLFYYWSMPTAWAIESASFEGTFDITSKGSHGLSKVIHIEADNNKLYTVPGSALLNIDQYSMPYSYSSKIDQFSISSPWLLDSASYDSVSFNVTAQDGEVVGLTLGNSGSSMYVLGGENSKAYQYSVFSAWLLDSASYDSVSFSTSAEDIRPEAIQFKDNGSNLFVMGGHGKAVLQYSVFSAWMLDSTSYEGVSFTVSAEEAYPMGLMLSNDYTKAYVVGSGAASVLQYSLNASYYSHIHQYTINSIDNIDSSSYDSSSFSITDLTLTPNDLAFNEEGNRLLIVDGDGSKIIQFTADSSFTISTLSYNPSTELYFGGTDTELLSFNMDGGNDLILLGGSTNTLYQYDIGISVDIEAEYDYVDGTVKIEDRHTTRSANEFVYKWAELRRVSFSVSYLSSEQANTINTQWKNNSDLVLRNLSNLSEVFTCRLINKALPIGQFVKPYDNLFKGKIELGKY